jgi:hypothetical protein
MQIVQKGKYMDPELIKAENRLTEAERAGNKAELSILLSEEFLGIDAHGRRFGKSEFIRKFCDSGLKFQQLQIADLNSLIPEGSFRIILGRSFYVVEVPGRRVEGSAQFMDCWNRTNGKWQLLASTVTPEER